MQPNSKNSKTSQSSAASPTPKLAPPKTDIETAKKLCLIWTSQTKNVAEETEKLALFLAKKTAQSPTFLDDLCLACPEIDRSKLERLNRLGQKTAYLPVL